MDIIRKTKNKVISHQLSVIKTSTKRKFLGFFKAKPRKHSNLSLKTGLDEVQPQRPPRLNLKKLFLKTKKRKLIFSLLLVLLIIAPLSFYLWNKKAGASWWNSDWNYRKSIAISNSSGATLTDFQVKILGNYDLSGDVSSGKIKSDLGDLRFTNSEGSILDYWIEDATNNSVDIWIKISSIPTSGTNIYMYYGNPQALSQADGNKTFNFFDDFNDGNIDPTKWVMSNYGSGGSFSESGGNLNLTGSNSQTGSATAKTIAEFTNDFVIEWRRYDTDEHYNDLSFGYGNVVAEGGGSSYWHTTVQYGYFDKVQDNTGFIYNRLSNGSPTTLQSSIDGPNAGQWIKYKNIYSNAGLWNWSYDIGSGFTLLGTGQTDATYLSNSKYILLARGGFSGNTWGGTSQYDYIFVHKYASAEPSISSIGQEEHGPAPALYLPLDEGFGTTAYDESSNRNDGNIVGATWRDESMCKNGKCLEFDGNDYVEINDDNSLDLDKEVTLEAWVKPTSTTPDNQIIISKEETANEPTKIYRSVGPSATTAIAVGTSNAMNITGDRATFQTALPDNVGVGDAIQYDDDDDSDIDTNDSIVFIHERINSKEYRVRTSSGGTPTPVNADTNWSLFRAYTSLSNAEAGIENTGVDSDLRNFDDWTAGGDATTDDVGKDLVASNQQWNIACYANGTTADTAAVSVDGWTTGVNSFIKIYTPVDISEVGLSQRHSGKWDDGKYRLELSAGYTWIFFLNDNFITVDGLQLFNNNTDNAGVLDVNSLDDKISNNIIKGGGGNNAGRYAIDIDGVENGIVTIWNNVIYNTNQGIFANFPTAQTSYIYNNVIYVAYYGINIQGPGAIINVKNNIVQQTSALNYCLTSATVISSHNISSDATAPGTDSKNSTTVSFVSTTAGSEDFHLSPTDTVAKNSGADLSADSVFPFNTDIDGQQRLYLPNGGPNSDDTKFDIGADEAKATQIYRSVAPGKTDALETGIDNSLTIIGNQATFQRSLADNIGVGDAIQYDDDGDGDIDTNDSIVFISGRVTSYEFLVTTATGGVPIAVVADTDWSIFRAYTSLANAENGDENTGIDSDLRNFDTWTGGKDLVTSKEQWNIACYANGTTADTTAVVVNGWTTGVQNFVKIYTPVNSNEVGITQRHSGKWDEGKYRLETGTGVQSLYISDDYAVVDGLQVTNSGTASTDACIEGDGYSKNIIIRSNILKGGYNGFYHTNANETSNGYRIYNNIVYGTNQAGIFFYNGTTIPSYVYNNTVYNCNIGNFVNRGGIVVSDIDNVVINNISINNGVSDFYQGTQSYNISSDSSATGTGSLVNKTLSDIDFVSTTSGSEDLHILGTSVARNAGANLSINPYLPITSDIDSQSRIGDSATGYSPQATGYLYDIGADEATATKIYRSVGPSNTTALATDESHENTVSVTNGIATFEVDLPDRIGVGDAVIIDTGGTANAIDASDTLLFIHGRNSSTSYELRTHTGAVPTNITSNDTYQIFRAYTSLANAESGTKNTSIPITFNGGNRDLVTNNEEWNITCYGDAVDTTTAYINGWLTSKENFIKIYTPVNNNETGNSQRHGGKLDKEKYYRTANIGIDVANVRVDGIQIHRTSTTGSWMGGIENGQAGGPATVADIRISNSIFASENISGTNCNGIQMQGSAPGSIMTVWNNIVYGGFNMGMYLSDGDFDFYVYNNVVYSSISSAYSIYGATHTLVKNNIVQNSSVGFIAPSTFAPGSDFNISDLASDAPGTNSKNSTTVTFRDTTNDDFRLAVNDTSAKGAGINLSNDLNLPIADDIEGELRPSLRQGSLTTSYQLQATNYDIGADQISTTTHNNYSLNLKTNYPQTNFSTSNNDKENFSSGDINLSPNEWSHLVYKRSNDVEEMYINGSKKDSGTISNFLKTNNGKLYLGSKDSSINNSFKGFMDEIRIYPYARTEDEIKKDTASGSSGRASSRATEGVSVAIGDQSSNLSDGLVGYWKMDETSWTGSANEVRDVSGNNNHGSRYGNATTGAGKFGNGGTFDGSGDYIQTGNSISMSDGFTVSSWARVGDNTQYNQLGIVATSVVDSNNGFVMEYRDAGSDDWLYLRVGTGSSDNLDFSDECYLTWCHYAFTYESNGNVISYVNGKNIGSFQATSNFDISGRINIGQANDGNDEYFNGNVDETRIYNRPLSGDEVNQLYNYAPGPVLHLKLDEKSGTTAYDSSGYNNHGTITGATWETGKNNGATKFINDTDQVLVSQSSSINNLKSFTYSAWVKSFDTGNGSRRPIMEKGSGSDIKKTITFGDHTGSSKRRVMVEVNTNGTTGEITTVNDTYGLNEWEYWTMTYDDNGTRIPKLYKNGVEVQYVSQVAATGVIDDDSARDLALGSSPGTNFYAFDGLVDDVKIYNYVRTQEQILEDMGASAEAPASRGDVLQKLILDLNFNEGYGNTANDSSGNGNNGTLNAGAAGSNTAPTMMWDKGGKEGGAMEFDNLNDYVNVGSNINIANKSFTISSWAKRNSNVSADYIAGQGTGSSSLGLHYGFRVGNTFTCAFNADDLNANIVSDTDWHHWVCSYDADTNLRIIYQDGKEIARNIANADYQGSGVFNVGARYSVAEEFFNGLIDDFKLYSYALSEEEIKTLYNGSSAMVMGSDESRNNNGTEVTGANKDYCVPGDTSKCDKPVLELKMNEKSGTTANDSSGNGNNGTLANGPVWDRGKINGGVSLGNGNYVRINDNAQLRPGTDDFTSSFWIKTPFSSSVAVSWPVIFSKGNTTTAPANTWGFMRYTNSNNRINYSQSSDTGGSFDVSLTTGNLSDGWHFISVRRSGSTVQLYVDGKFFSEDTSAGSNLSSASDIYLGGNISDGAYFLGTIDQILYFNYARTPAQIAWDYNQGLPINNWTFDEGTGTTAHDMSEGKNHGTITGATWKNESECKTGKCLYFNGADQTRVAADTIDNMTNFTACAWMKASALINSGNDPWMVVLNKSWSIRLYNNGRLRFENPTSGTYPYLVTQNSLTANEWYRVCGVYYSIGITPKIYLNGIEQLASASDPGNGTHTDDGPSGLEVGSDTGGWADNFYGYIDDPKIYNYPLTTEQAKQDYNGGAVSFE